MYSLYNDTRFSRGSVDLEFYLNSKRKINNSSNFNLIHLPNNIICNIFHFLSFVDFKNFYNSCYPINAILIEKETAHNDLITRINKMKGLIIDPLSCVSHIDDYQEKYCILIQEAIRVLEEGIFSKFLEELKKDSLHRIFYKASLRKIGKDHPYTTPFAFIKTAFFLNLMRELSSKEMTGVCKAVIDVICEMDDCVDTLVNHFALKEFYFVDTLEQRKEAVAHHLRGMCQLEQRVVL